MYACYNCRNLINVTLLKVNEEYYCCPTIGCYTELINVDNEIADLLTEFWKNKIRTISSCSGDIYSTIKVPHISFPFNIYNDECMYCINSYDVIFIEILSIIFDKIGLISIDLKTSSIELSLSELLLCEWKYISIRKRIELKYQFISLLYDTINQVTEKRSKSFYDDCDIESIEIIANKYNNIKIILDKEQLY